MQTEEKTGTDSLGKKMGIVFIFLAGIAIGASGLWLIVQNTVELRYYWLEHPTGNQPQAQGNCSTGQAHVRNSPQ